MITIEFFGTPGSGKSTISALLKKHLKKKRYNILDEDEAFYYCFSLSRNPRVIRLTTRLLRTFGISYKALRLYYNRHILGPEEAKSLKVRAQEQFMKERPELVSLVMEQIRNTHGDRRWREFAELIFFELMSKQKLFEGYLTADTIVITDEWFIHFPLSSLVSINSYGTEAELKKYFGLIPKPNIVICVDSDVDTCLSRIESRDEGHIVVNNISEEEKIRFIQNNHETVVNIKNQIDDFIRIDNSRDVRALAPSVLEYIGDIEQSIARFL
jgi:thymidylate kinase